MANDGGGHGGWCTVRVRLRGADAHAAFQARHLQLGFEPTVVRYDEPAGAGDAQRRRGEPQPVGTCPLACQMGVVQSRWDTAPTVAGDDAEGVRTALCSDMDGREVSTPQLWDDLVAGEVSFASCAALCTAVALFADATGLADTSTDAHAVLLSVCMLLVFALGQVR